MRSPLAVIWQLFMYRAAVLPDRRSAAKSSKTERARRRLQPNDPGDGLNMVRRMNRFDQLVARGKALASVVAGGLISPQQPPPRRHWVGACLVVVALAPGLASCAQKSPAINKLAQTPQASQAAAEAIPSFSTRVLPRKPGAAATGSRSGSTARTSAQRRRIAARSRYDPKTGVYASERLITGSRPVPKGGGNYKVGKPYKVSGRLYVPKLEPNYNRTGEASWYGDKFHGRRTANGETYDMGALSAAHPTMPLPSYAYVTNLANGRTVLVRVNDRGPYAKGRIIDLSRAAANALSFRGQGVARVRVRYGGRAPLSGSDHKERAFLRQQSWSGRTASTGPASRASGLSKIPSVW